MLQNLKTAWDSKIFLLVGFISAALALASCDGGGKAFESSPQLDAAMYKFLSARNLAAEYASLAQDKLKDPDLTQSRQEYMRLQSAANAWIEVVAMDIRNGITPDPQMLAQLQSDTKKFIDNSREIADNIDRRVSVVFAQQNTPFAPIRVGAVNPLELGKGLSDMYVSISESATRNAGSRILLRQAEQAMRDRLADEILVCAAWPRWQEIKSPNYRCTSLAPAALPSGVPAVGSGR